MVITAIDIERPELSQNVHLHTEICAKDNWSLFSFPLRGINNNLNINLMG